jgi:hypothetical protein
MTTDPWLLVAQRHFQDMRQDAVGGELLAAASTDNRPGRIGRLVERFGATFQALRRQPADDLPAPDEVRYEHPVLDGAPR